MQPTTIYVMQMAHTDLGYTHPREQIERMYLDIYDRVLQLCEQSAGEPEQTRFKWTCETAWQVHHYLRHRPEREEEFVQFVRQGQIEVTAAYLHFTDMIDADAYARSLDWAVRFCRERDLPLRCALHSDINGWPWSVADSLAERNIPYFCSHVHLDSATDPLGKRGSGHYMWRREWAQDILRADMPVRIPQAFYWQGPRGGSVLHWLNEHYMLGNVLGVSSSQGFGANKTQYFTEYDQMSVDELYQQVQRELPLYLQRLHADGYPYASMLLSTGGFYVDNAPPDTRWLQVIARWNREHGDVQLRTATPGEWFAYLEKVGEEKVGWEKVGEEKVGGGADAGAGAGKQNWPVYQVAWPDGWSHGLGSESFAIAQARRTQRRRADAIALVEKSQSGRAQELLEQALEYERIALEHTFNAWCSVAQPYAPNTRMQHDAKMLTFQRAELYLDMTVGTALRALLPAKEQPRLCVPVANAAAGQRVVHFSADDLTLDAEGQRLSSGDGQEVAFQVEAQGPLRYVAVVPTEQMEQMEQTGIVELGITTPSRVVSASTSPLLFTNEQRQVGEQVARDGDVELRTPFWRLLLDPQTGGLQQLTELATGQQWAQTMADQPYAFGQLVHERVVHPLGRAAVGNTARFIALDVATEQLRESFAPGPIVEHTTMQAIDEPVVVSGPVFDELRWRGRNDALGELQVAWRGYHALPLVELVLTWEKLWCDAPEAAYVAFPFHATESRLELETGGGWFRPGIHERGGQLPGTISHYYTIGRAARFPTASGRSMYWLPLDAPLVMPNAINYNNWETTPWQWNGFLASMPVNHYWHTNFAASQRGQVRLRYRFITSSIFEEDESALLAAMPVEAYGWR